MRRETKKENNKMENTMEKIFETVNSKNYHVVSSNSKTTYKNYKETVTAIKGMKRAGYTSLKIKETENGEYYLEGYKPGSQQKEEL
jgi:hypothetical protein